MSEPLPTPPPEDDEDDPVTLRDVVLAFLAAFPEPTDEQTHKFAEALGIDYKEFEEEMFAEFGDEIADEDPEEILEDEDLVEDDLDMFIVAFYIYTPHPTEEQIHALAELIQVTPEELEERTMRMLQLLKGFDVDDDDFDDDDADDESAPEDKPATN